MPSLFSRSQHAPKKDRAPAVLVANPGGPDRRVLGLAKTWNGSSVQSSSNISEFGTVPPVSQVTAPSNGHNMASTPSEHSLLPGGPPTFLPTTVPLSATQAVTSLDSGRNADGSGRPYGFLAGVGRNVILGVDEVARIIREVGAELARRALDTPLLFSNQNLELNQVRMKMLIQTYIGTIRTHNRTPTKTALATWEQDLKFANDQELAWLLRWALSRMTRVRDGTREVSHGCIEWEQYEEWRGRERAAKYPYDAFNMLATILPADIYTYIISPLFALLSKCTAHSHNSGLTPHALASHFAPLLFDIPTNVTCLASHTVFVRAAAATEHMILANIRASGRPTEGGGLGITDLPSRLKEWVAGYPSMVVSDADLARGMPRRAARVIRCETASRTVRAYSRDLVATAELWGSEVPNWDAWDRVILKEKRGEAARPKFSASYRRKMAVKETLPLPASSQRSQQVVYGAPLNRGGLTVTKIEKDESEAGRFASLAGKEWSAFEELGFDSEATSRRGEPERPDMQSRLQFDLNESAKQSVAERRQTMDWSDFADGGFTRTESFLTASLTFSAPIQSSITEWPKERDELQRRLHKTQKEATPFNYDTTPRVGRNSAVEGIDDKGRVYIEEAFIDCWTDFMMGAGWMDREELTFKEASWALVEYKAKPNHPDAVDSFADDPRETELHFLFEERVPLEYQMAIADPKRKKTLGKLFAKRSRRGQPPPKLSPRDDFEKMLTVNRTQQKRINLTRADQSVSSQLWQALNEPTPLKKSNSGSSNGPGGYFPTQHQLQKTQSPTLAPPLPEKDSKPANPGSSKTRIFKSIRRVKSSGRQREAAKQREVSMDFEVHSASGLSSGASSPENLKSTREEEKWMDILIANGARPMDQAPSSGAPLRAATSQSSTIRRVTPPSRSPARDDLTPPASQLGDMHITPVPKPAGLQSPIHMNGHGVLEALDHDSPEPSVTRSKDSSYEDSVRESRESVVTDDASVLPSDSISMRRPISDADSGTEVFSPIEAPPLPPLPAVQARGPLPPLPPVPSKRALPPTPQAEAPITGGYHSPTEYQAGGGAAAEYQVPGGYGAADYQPAELIQPRPRQHSDHGAMASIVDGYSRDSVADDVYGGLQRDSIFSQTYASERGDSVYERESMDTGVGGVDDLPPPGPIFDLTPGREPSPARYKHGEPLQFVGEEDEEEEEDEYYGRHRY